MTNLLTHDWLTDDWLLWMTHWMSDWLNYWLTDWLTGWLATDWLTDYWQLSNWIMTNWLNDGLTKKRLNGCLTDDWLTTDWLTDWLTDQLDWLITMKQIAMNIHIYWLITTPFIFKRKIIFSHWFNCPMHFPHTFLHQSAPLQTIHISQAHHQSCCLPTSESHHHTLSWFFLNPLLQRDQHRTYP